MSPVENLNAPVPSPSEYILDNFEATDRIAMLVLNRDFRETIQRITSAQKASSPEFQAWLRYKNANGADIYVGMNSLRQDASTRTKEDIESIRHVYLDLDHGGQEALKAVEQSNAVPKPNYVLTSSPGKFHVVWKVHGMSLDEAEALLHAMAREFGGDPAATDATRVLRLPGFANKKYGTDFFVEPHIYLGDTVYEPDRGERYDVVLTNPPFGTRGANQAPDRDDFTIETSNKQLNFLQHVMNTLKPGGRAAMVLPDNCLFEGKAGEVFQILIQDCNLHTILRLPRGTFTPYSQGVKANVIFFQKGRPTEDVWIFDGRSNVPGITKKDRPLTKEHFKEFEECYGKDPNGLSKRTDTGENGRFRKFSVGEIKERDYKLDITWLKDESLEENGDLPDPQDLAAEAITELEAVVDDLREIVALVEKEEGVEQ